MIIKNKNLNLKKNNSIKNSQAYWESYSIQVPDGYKDHWIDDDGKPLSFDNKTEIFKVFKSIAENTVNSLKKIKIKDVEILS